MSEFAMMTRGELHTRAARLDERYLAFKAQRLALDMTRGKPCREQLDLSAGLLDCLGQSDYRAADGTDCRNYGGLDGLPEARTLFADFLEVDSSEVIVGGNSSLTMMHDTVVQALLRGMPGGTGPWRTLPAVKFLCPSPGYDRHFAICEHLGIEMLTVDMTSAGPDMDQVEHLVAEDASIKGIWCVPKYSNPTGVTFSDAVVERLAHMHTAALDFRIFWDNAYAVHHLSDTPDRLRSLPAACTAAGNADRVLLFASTSKVSFAGAGVAAMAGSTNNVRHIKAGMAIQTIGPDKLNQLRHVRFFRDMAGIEAQMRKHAAILRPKFAAVQEVLTRELEGTGVAQWSRPNGGYFISLDTLDGCAKAVVAMAADAGVQLTQAGATFPCGKDPRDRNIRLAPSMPSVDEIRQAMELVAVCTQRVAIARLLER
ncbi:MAG TPA: aminotransferase class I/II-fold pyridoxal phosphate-dependent enzyme [Candidatus Margulisiibacteriota bacterium]|nr:aminotransferase class I/II-fold pyridoxal phosphate-dependent enzyme [Candidatus Margulisiibacteriota bacterium]